MSSRSLVTYAIQLKILENLLNISEIYVKNIPIWTSNSLKGGKQRGGALKTKDFFALLISFIIFTFTEIKINYDNVEKLLQILKQVSQVCQNMYRNANSFFEATQNMPLLQPILRNVLERESDLLPYIQSITEKHPGFSPSLVRTLSIWKRNMDREMAINKMLSATGNFLIVSVPLLLIFTLLNKRYDIIGYVRDPSVLTNIQKNFFRIKKNIKDEIARFSKKIQGVPFDLSCLGQECPISLESFTEDNIQFAIRIDQQCYDKRELLHMLDLDPYVTIPHTREPFSPSQLNAIEEIREYIPQREEIEANGGSARRRTKKRKHRKQYKKSRRH